MDVFATGMGRYAHTLVVQEVAERQLLLLRFLGCYIWAMLALDHFFCLSVAAKPFVSLTCACEVRWP
jgi:hypothetical protein